MDQINRLLSLDGTPEEVAEAAVRALRQQVENTLELVAVTEAMVRNARLTQISEAVDPRSIGISPTPELYAAWEASVDASLCARLQGVLELAERLSKALFPNHTG